jgi:GxxExxY protein
MDIGYRLDILINDKVVIEVKSIESVTEACQSQVLTYLKLTGCEIGLLINFNVTLLKNEIKRIIRSNPNSDSNLDIKSS